MSTLAGLGLSGMEKSFPVSFGLFGGANEDPPAVLIKVGISMYQTRRANIIVAESTEDTASHLHV